MLDHARMDELKAEIGEEDFAEVLEMFVEEIEAQLSRLTDHLTAGRMAEELHALKGSALNVGFHAFADMCQKAEVALKSDDDMTDLNHRLRSAFHASRAAAQRLV